MSDERDEKKDDNEGRGSTQTLPRPSSKTKTPNFYKVIILNDDFTPRDFVVHILKKFFKKDDTEATILMMDVHNKGAGIAGVYTFEIAETKSYQVNEYSRSQNYPLKCTVEKV
jgi:ATP-dependent Clp protease adaptor protein ClpS